MPKYWNALPGPTNASNTVNSAQQLEPHSHLHPLVSTKRGHAVPPHHQHNQAEAQCKCWSNARTELDSHLSAGLDMGSLSAHAKLKCPAPNQARPSSSPTSAWASNPTQPQELECSESQIASFGTAPHQSSHKMQQCDKFKHFCIQIGGMFWTQTTQPHKHLQKKNALHPNVFKPQITSAVSFSFNKHKQTMPRGLSNASSPPEAQSPCACVIASLRTWAAKLLPILIHCAILLSVKIRAHVSPTMRLFLKSLIC